MAKDDKFLAYKGLMEAPKATGDLNNYVVPVFDIPTNTMYRTNIQTIRGGFLVDYNDASTAATPISLTADVWADVPNDGAGSFTNLQFLPDYISRLMDTSNGKIDPSELNLGSSLLIRNDFTVTPQTNNSSLEFQYTLGSGASAYTLGLALGRLDRGAGVGYRFSMRVDKIYMGDHNTRDNPIGLQVKCSSDATLVNAGVAITVVNN